MTCRIVGTISIAIAIILMHCITDGMGSRQRIQKLSKRSKTELSQEIFIDLDVLRHIESGGANHAVNLRTGAIGAFQITPQCLEDYNTFGPNPHKTIFPIDLFDPIVSRYIANWYINKRIPDIFRAKGIRDSKEARLIAYSSGFKYFHGAKLSDGVLDYINLYRCEELRRRSNERV